MATVREADLAQVVSLADADYIRAVSSNGASEIIKYSVLRERIVAEVLEDMSVVPIGYCYCASINSITIAAQNSPTKIPITAMNLQDGFSYDSSERGIKVSKAGVYAISAQTSCSVATSGDMMGLAIYKNGSLFGTWEYTRVGGTYDRINVLPTILNLSAGDTITVYGQNRNGARGSYDTLRLAIWRVA